MPISVNLIRKLESVPKDLREVLLDLVEELERQREESITKREFDELREIVKEIARETQRLAEAQRRTEEELRRTQEELRILASEHRKTREQLGGLAQTVEYRLGDKAFRSLPRLLERDYGIVVEGRLKRGFVKDNRGQYLEVNILGEGRRNGEKVVIVGEAKARLSKRDVDRFVRSRLKRLEGVFERIFPVVVTYMISEPDVEDYARSKGIALYYSYDF